MLRDALLENLHRSDLNPLEEASAALLQLTLLATGPAETPTLPVLILKGCESGSSQVRELTVQSGVLERRGPCLAGGLVVRLDR